MFSEILKNVNYSIAYLEVICFEGLSENVITYKFISMYGLGFIYGCINI